MQFTGLYDKNGREIYEGDIVKRIDLFNHPDGIVIRLPVTFYKGAFGFLEERDNFNKDKILLPLTRFPFIIIGNIYENPELLENINEN
jgi:hypothetical protein